MFEARLSELEKLLPNLTDSNEIERVKGRIEIIKAKILQIQEKIGK